MTVVGELDRFFELDQIADFGRIVARVCKMSVEFADKLVVVDKVAIGFEWACAHSVEGKVLNLRFEFHISKEPYRFDCTFSYLLG